MKQDFVDSNKNVHYIEDIVRCEERMEFVKNFETPHVFAIFKNGKEVLFDYYKYRVQLENYQKISRDQK